MYTSQHDFIVFLQSYSRNPNLPMAVAIQRTHPPTTVIVATV